MWLLRYLLSRIVQAWGWKFSKRRYAQLGARLRRGCVMKFSPDLAFRVSSSLERLGYCIFGVNELDRLFSQAKETRGRLHVLEEFASLCGAKVETTPHFKSARFTRAVAVGS
jgi:hypothetical protein